MSRRYQGGNQGGKRSCKFWAQGNCNRGNKCKFRHEGSSGSRSSSHKKSSGNYSSQHSNHSSPRGSYSSQNDPSPRGSYSSPVNNSNRKVGTALCRNFKKGHCKFGANCRFVHQGQQSRNQNQQSRGRRNNNNDRNNGNNSRTNSAPPRTNNQSAFSTNTNRSKSHSRFAPTNFDPKDGNRNNDRSFSQTHNKVCRGHKSNRCHEYVKRDFREQSWALSCYGHDTHFANCIKGDVSFEEVRLAYYTNPNACGVAYNSRAEIIYQKQKTIEQNTNLLFQEDTDMLAPFVVPQIGASLPSVQSNGRNYMNSTLPPQKSVFPTTNSVFSPTIASAFPSMVQTPTKMKSAFSGPISSAFSGPVSSAFSGPVSSAFSGPVSSAFSGPISSAFSGPISSAFSGPISSAFSGPISSAFSKPISSAFSATARSAFSTTPNNIFSTAENTALSATISSVPPSRAAVNASGSSNVIRSSLQVKGSGPVPAHCMSSHEIMKHFTAPAFTIGHIPEEPPPQSLA